MLQMVWGPGGLAHRRAIQADGANPQECSGAGISVPLPTRNADRSGRQYLSSDAMFDRFVRWIDG
jgi:hypothetical protein